MSNGQNNINYTFLLYFLSIVFQVRKFSILEDGVIERDRILIPVFETKDKLSSVFMNPHVRTFWNFKHTVA